MNAFFFTSPVIDLRDKIKGFVVREMKKCRLLKTKWPKLEGETDNTRRS